MNEFNGYLDKFRKKHNLRSALRSALEVLIVLAAAVHLYFLVWLSSDPYASLIRLFGVSLKVSLVLILIYLIFGGYRRFWSLFQVARYLDGLEDYGDDLLQNALELSNKGGNETIVGLLRQQGSQRLARGSYPLPRFYEAWRIFALVFLLLGLATIWAFNPQDFVKSLKQFYTNKAEAIVYKEDIEISPGNLMVGRGNDVKIHILNPEKRLQHRLFYRFNQDWRELSLADFAYTFAQVENSFEYYVSTELGKTPVYRIDVLDLPFVKHWWVEYNYPPYTRFKPELDTLSYGHIEALKYTQIKLALETNIPLKTAVLHFTSGAELSLQALDERNYITTFQLLKEDSYYLTLTDALGRTGKPEEKRVRLVADNPPEVRFAFPAEDTMLNQNLLLPLIILADDDFGLKNLSLKYRINDKEEQSLILQTLIEGKMLQKEHVFDLREMALFPGDVVSYWAEVYDNSPDSQKGVSKVFKARFPSIEEIYRALEEGESKKQDELQSALKKSQEIQKEFEQKRRELLKKENPDWDDQKQLQEVLQNQEQLAEQVEQLAENYQELIEKMQSNQALSPDTLEKMMKIQELMQEIANEDLLKAMEKFENALKDLNPEQIKKAMENFKFSMEDFSQKIEQTLDLLESIKKEQAVQKALQISEEMEKMQKDLHDRSADSKSDNQRLAQEQQSIQEKYENLKKELEKLDQMLDPKKDAKAKSQLSELQNEMQKSKMEESLQKSSDQLKANQRSSAQSSQQEAMEKMRIFTKKLAEMKSSMASGSAQDIKQAMQTAIRELLIFSKKHEELSARFNRDPYTIIADLIAAYEGIQISLNKLYASPQVMMFIPPKFFIDLTGTYTAYRDVFVNIGENQFFNYNDALARIQSGLNLMVYDLMQGMQNQSSGSGGGGGMQSLMQMLEQMGQEQMAMNMMMQQMLQQMQENGGRMNPAMQQQLQKLANDTDRMVENLKRSLQNNSEAQKQGNAIKQIIEEAESLSRQLRSNQMNQDVMNRQERILSKLLDAQRSLNKRDTTQKRKGETAEQKLFQRKAGVNDYNLLRKGAAWDEDYRSYPKEYQEVIIRYLKQLGEQGQ